MATDQHNILPDDDAIDNNKLNRARQMRRDNDTVKTPSVSLYDIDYAIMYHMTDNMKLQIQDGGRSVNVPVIYGDSEKWMQIKSRGHLRDTSNKIMAPMIVIRRVSVSDDPRIPILDLNNHTPHRKFYPYKTMNMQYDKLSGQQVRKPSYEFYMVDTPNYVQVEYELMLWTDHIEQMNYITQALISVSGHIWGDYHSFRTVVSNTSMTTANNVGEDRLITTSVNLTVDGYLLDEFEYHEPTMKKAYTIKTVNFETERETMDFYIDSPPSIKSNITRREPRHLQLANKRRNLRY